MTVYRDYLKEELAAYSFVTQEKDRNLPLKVLLTFMRKAGNYYIKEKLGKLLYLRDEGIEAAYCSE